MRVIRYLVAAALLLLIGSPLTAQPASWQQLHNHVAELLATHRNSELVSAALETLRVAESTFGIMHPATAVSTYDVAIAYDTTHQFVKAETFYRRALTLEEKALGPNSPEIPKCLNNLAMLYVNNHRDADAAPLLQRAVDLLGRAPDSSPSNLIVPMVNLAEVYRRNKKYADAETLYRRALVIAEKDTSQGHIEPDVILHSFALLYTEEGKPHDAEIALKRALNLCERAYGPGKPQTARVLKALGATESNLGNYAEAESYLIRALQIQQQTATSDIEVAELSNNLAKVYRFQGKRAEEEQLLRRELSVRDKADGPSSPQIVESLLALAGFYRDEGRPADSRPLCERAVSLQEKAAGGDDPALVEGLLCIGSSYLAEEKFALGEPAFRRAIHILQSPGVNKPAALANALNSLAELYKNAGRFADAEPLYRQSLEITNRTSGTDNADYARTSNNLGLLFQDEGRFSDAEPLHKQSLAILEKVAGPEKLETTYALNSLAVLYQKEGRLHEAEPLFRRALQIREKVYGLDHPLVGTVVNNLATLFKQGNRCPDAEPLQRRALAIDEKRLGPAHPVVAIDLSNLGRTLACLGNYPAAGEAYSRALQIVDKALEPHHPDMIAPLQNLASYYFGVGDYLKAAPLFSRLLVTLEYRFRYQFSYMSEKDRLSFLATVDDVFPRYFSFCLKYHDRDPSLASRMYDVALWEKGLVARSVVSLGNQVAASHDPQALAALKQLSLQKARLSNLELTEVQHPGPSREAIAKLQHAINDLEAELARRSSTFANHQHLDAVKSSDIAKALKPGESAIEFLRFTYFDGRKWQGDEYAALVLHGGASPPTLLSLGAAALLDGVPLADYRARVKERSAPEDVIGSTFYKNFWKPLEAPLAGSKRIYISPDGLLSEVAWGVLPAGGGRLLCDQYEIELLSSTRDLLNKSSFNSARTAVLVGSPDFNISETQYRAAIGKKPASSSHSGQIADLTKKVDLRTGEGTGQSLAPLPGTFQEIQDVRTILQQHGWKVTVYTGADALEENVKAVQSPALLHLATHGFFNAESPASHTGDKLSDPTIKPMLDPMLRSGLYLAGADRALAGKAPFPGLDDGVLTAFEGSSLDLSGTELVILSACETGLGDTRNGEGVFGLRRALQEAGAKAVLMSLWKVPDQETGELMKLFYEKWLSGENKQRALREAQREMRERVKARRDGDDVPFYWGAFVLVGN